MVPAELAVMVPPADSAVTAKTIAALAEAVDEAETAAVVVTAAEAEVARRSAFCLAVTPARD